MKVLNEVKIFGSFSKYLKKRMPAFSGAGIKATKEKAEEPIVESACFWFEIRGSKKEAYPLCKFVSHLR